jgi:hypothetical protein
MPKGSEYRQQQAADLRQRVDAARAKDATAAAQQTSASKDGKR